MRTFDPDVLRDLMDRQHLTTGGLADRIRCLAPGGCCRYQTVAHWLTGARRPGADYLAATAEALGVPMERLFRTVQGATLRGITEAAARSPAAQALADAMAIPVVRTDARRRRRRRPLD